MQILYHCFVNILYFLLVFSNPSSISPELYSGYIVHCPALYAVFFVILQANLIRRSIKNKRVLLEHPPASFIIPSLGKLCFSMYQKRLSYRQNWYMLIHESPT